MTQVDTGVLSHRRPLFLPVQAGQVSRGCACPDF